MAFPPAYDHMYYYDVYPLVVPAGKETVIHIKPLGGRKKFLPGKNYAARILGRCCGSPSYYPVSCDVTELTVPCNDIGGFDIPCTFKSEQEYSIRLTETGDESNALIEHFQVYCIADDLAGKYPFVGDLHLHTTYSDGNEDPEVVCANYRAYGYDFLAITDHRRYYPSLRARDFYKDLPTDLTIVPGEEVHLPKPAAGPIEPHIVNFGGTYSVNAMIEAEATDEVGTAWETRSLSPDCPPVMTKEAFSGVIDELIEKTDVPAGIDPVAAVGSQWIFNQIRKAGGLAIYVHPTWINQHAYHVPDALHDYFVENKLFDAFEVLGGETYYEQNGFQTIRYYQDQAKGYRYPVVGSTDSHRSYLCNKKGFICSTIVFSEKNERQALIDAIKDFRSVAVDTISKEFRLVGDLRLVRYGCFLLKNYFPLHDILCQEEGRMMRQYAVGTEDEKQDALNVLTALHGRIRKQRQKYFAF